MKYNVLKASILKFLTKCSTNVPELEILIAKYDLGVAMNGCKT